MEHQIASKLALDSGADDPGEAVSQPVAIGGDNSVKISTTVLDMENPGTTQITYLTQQSNDLQNWADVAGSNTTDTIGHTHFTAQTVEAAYVRVRFTIQNGYAVFAAGMNTSSQ